MGLYITRFFSNQAQMQYTTRKYANEMSRDIDLQQTINTLSKVETMAIVTRDRIATGDETLQELEDDYQRMDKLRNVRRVVLAEGGMVEMILRNFDYYPSHVGATRAALKSLVSLIASDICVTRFMDQSIAEEKESDRRIAGVKVKEVTFTRVEKKRGLGLMNAAMKQAIPQQTSTNNLDEIDPEENKILQETKHALEFAIHAELTPRLPLKICRAAALFVDDEVVQECIEEISDAIRGIHYPIQTIQTIIQQATTYHQHKFPESGEEEEDNDPHDQDENNERNNERTDPSIMKNDPHDQDGNNERTDPSLMKSRSKLRSKYASNISETKQNTRVAKSQKKQCALPPFKKGDRIEAQLQTYWRKRYVGTIIKVKRKRSLYMYNVKFDDGEIYKKVLSEKVSIPSIPILEPEESLRSLLRIAAYPRWQTRPDLQTLCIRAIKLVLDCGDPRADSRLFVMLDGVNILLSSMKLFPNSARLNMRSAQLMISVILNSQSRGSFVRDESNPVNEEEEEERLRFIEVESRCSKAFGAAGAIALLCDMMKNDFFDDELNLTVRKQGVWALHCLAVDRNNRKILESCGGMYVLKLAAQDPSVVISRRLKSIDWKVLRESRLAGGIDDELEKLKYISDLFVDCIHEMAGMKCGTPGHCKQCFVNKHATGFWHEIGCKDHPGNTDVRSLLQMKQMRSEKERHWANNQDAVGKKSKKSVLPPGDGDVNASMLGIDSKKANRGIPEEWL